MGNLPAFTDHAQQQRVPVGIEGSLRKDEIDVGLFAVRDEPGGNEVVAFIPGEGPGARVGDEDGGHQCKRDSDGRRRFVLLRGFVAGRHSARHSCL